MLHITNVTHQQMLHIANVTHFEYYTSKMLHITNFTHNKRYISQMLHIDVGLISADIVEHGVTVHTLQCHIC